MVKIHMYTWSKFMPSVARLEIFFRYWSSDEAFSLNKIDYLYSGILENFSNFCEKKGKKRKTGLFWPKKRKFWKMLKKKEKKREKKGTWHPDQCTRFCLHHVVIPRGGCVVQIQHSDWSKRSRGMYKRDDRQVHSRNRCSR